jgi:hypothetical protein
MDNFVSSRQMAKDAEKNENKLKAKPRVERAN